MNSILRNTRKHDVAFLASGRIDISSRIAKMLGIRNNDIIDVAQEQGEYYLYVRVKADDVVGRHEAQCHPTNRTESGTRRYIRAYSKRLCSAMLAIANQSGIARLAAGEVIMSEKLGTLAVPLITHNPL